MLSLLGRWDTDTDYVRRFSRSFRFFSVKLNSTVTRTGTGFSVPRPRFESPLFQRNHRLLVQIRMERPDDRVSVTVPFVPTIASSRTLPSTPVCWNRRNRTGLQLLAGNRNRK